MKSEYKIRIKSKTIKTVQNEIRIKKRNENRERQRLRNTSRIKSRNNPE
jgi:hypothetical protein